MNRGNKTNSKLWNRYRVWAGEQVSLQFFNWPVVLYDQVRFRALGRDPRRRVITSETQLVIDGFPSSANSFLQRCLEQLVTMNELKFSDHQHSPAMVVKAVRMKVPTILCIREPKECCSSASVRWTAWSLEEYLRRYIKFYGLLLPYLDGVLICPFEKIIKDPLQVFRDTNKRFGLEIPTDCKLIDLTEAEQPGLSKEDATAFKAETRAKKLEKLAEIENSAVLKDLVRIASEVHQKVMTHQKGSI